MISLSLMITHASWCRKIFKQQNRIHIFISHQFAWETVDGDEFFPAHVTVMGIFYVDFLNILCGILPSI